MKKRFQAAMVKIVIGRMFSIIFLIISFSLIGLSGFQFYVGLTEGRELISIFVQLINTLIIALAIFELGIGILKEYGNREEEFNTYILVRRTITRFVGTVTIALVLESLIMIIKYSQLELAGNLNYPVAILAATSLLLISLGLFLHFSRFDCEENDKE